MRIPDDNSGNIRKFLSSIIIHCHTPDKTKLYFLQSIFIELRIINCIELTLMVEQYYPIPEFYHIFDFDNDCKILCRFINNGLDIVDIDKYDGTGFLHTTIKRGNIELARFLIYKKLSVNKKDDIGRTPLDIAMADRNINTVQFLKPYYTPLEFYKSLIKNIKQRFYPVSNSTADNLLTVFDQIKWL